MESDGTEELAIARQVANRWAMTYGLDVEEATGVAAAAIVAARPSWDAARGPWPPFAAMRGLAGLTNDRRARRALKRGAPGLLVTDPPADSAPTPELARDEVRALLERRGATALQADTLTRWLAGETDAAAGARRGVSSTAVKQSRHAAMARMGLSREEARALRGLIRGDLLADLAWDGDRPVSPRSARVKERERYRAKFARRPPVDPSTIYYRQMRALAKLRGTG